MKPNCLILSTSHSFPLLARDSLENFCHCRILNLRYSNENLDENWHFGQQIREIYIHNLYNRGLIDSKYDFVVNEHLTNRIDIALEHEPKIIFFEMRTLKPSEWEILEYIRKASPVPIVVYLTLSQKDNNVLQLILKKGVDRIIISLDDEVIAKTCQKFLTAPLH